jgi:XTP/dITP diphosphohydrolase
VKLYCATTNPGKLREFRLAAAEYSIEVEPVPDLKNIPAPEEDGATFEQNAILKAVYYSGFVDGPVFADDSGLEVDALGGAPGVYSARFAGEQASDLENNRRLVETLCGVEDRTARFICVIAVAQSGKCLDMFRGSVEGRIVDDARGPGGFGYDPHFFYEPFGCTFGEASAEQKMAVSHRGQALRSMLTEFGQRRTP